MARSIKFVELLDSFSEVKLIFGRMSLMYSKKLPSCALDSKKQASISFTSSSTYLNQKSEFFILLH